jgi:catechol 2,3-dioxygenase-like lactoylglutathione lyase family enzyme
MRGGGRRRQQSPGEDKMAVQHDGDIALAERSSGDLTINTNGVLHFSISVRDHVKSAEWYRDVVGARIARVNDHFAFMQAGKDYFVLVRKDDHAEPNAPGDTQFHYAFTVTPPDFDKAMEILKRRNIEIAKYEDFNQGDPKRRGGRTFPGRHVYFYDADMNCVEIIDLQPGGLP